jgi:tRNA-specific 2-thiouridylase
VLSITPVSNTVTVGPVEALEVSTVVGERPLWTQAGTVRAEVQLRAHGEAVPATVELTGDRLVATLDRPVRGIAAGQAMVAYQPDADGDIVLGSATIAAAPRLAEAA